MAQDVTARASDYLAAMVRRAAPADGDVVPGSTPVVAFGDPTGAEIASLGINPSVREFTDKAGRWLRGDDRRLATLESLDAGGCDELTDAQVATVVADCAAYFNRNPYRRWFNPLDRVLRGAAGVSYDDGTACHLDLVQWATDPVWSRLSDHARRTLLDDGIPHLHAQLTSERIRVVVLNGKQVIDQVNAIGLADLDEVGVLPRRRDTCRLYTGTGSNIQWFGWSTNLQGSWGVTIDFKTQLAGWLREAMRQ